VNAFRYAQAHDVPSAIVALASDPRARYIAGGTNVVDLIKEGVERPSLLVDITQLPLREIERTPKGVRVGALALMSDVADHPAIARDYPVVAQALLASASPQLRNMATIGGNLMQRTRCAYFRDVSQRCNKRVPGSGCAAIAGVNRRHAVVGGSEHCICTHASDLAVALLSVDAIVHVRGRDGERSVPLERFHVLPGSTPQRETVLEPGDLITAVELPASAAARNSYYLKVRDRASYEFALVSVAAALNVAGDRIRAARVALGGVAPTPWRARAAEAALLGRPVTGGTFAAAAEAATSGMKGYGQNDFKIALVKRAVNRALQHVGGVA
jgi:xanthine dehydrogenase YagS FAD-binding subunit